MSHYGEGVRRANAVDAALKQLKPYGYGIVDKDGRSVETFNTRAFAIIQSGALDQDFQSRSPHRVVELFYKDAE